ncbi:MAG: hypothetical protein EOP10_03130 [Proteobacteria bacterium]|nr:MAG: hypothetical protein EOP10_03130 [Pseudomonadota bacterium]
MKDFHSRHNSQSGASMVVLLVGMALSAISIAAASAFFVQSNTKAKALMGESESVAHLAILLKQSFTKDKCLELDMYKGRFLKSIKQPMVLTDEVPSSAPKAGSSSMDTKSVALLRNTLGKSYDVVRMRMVQRSSVMGKDPGRVLADLQVQVTYRGAPDAKKDKENSQVLIVPVLFDVDNAFLSIGCMNNPLASDICAKNQGKYDEKATDQVCNLKKR